MENQENKTKGLPENAYRELKKGETYRPLMSPDKVYPEVSVWSVSVGILMTVIFSAAAAFLGLKVGQVFEAAIPIAIIAVGVGSVMGKKNMLGQNVIIQSIGASSGVIVAGAIFTLPALYLWANEGLMDAPNLLEITLIANAFRGIKLAVGILILNAALNMLQKMKKKPLTIGILLAVCAILVFSHLLGIRFSSIWLMLGAGAVSAALFSRKKGGRA